MNEFITTLFLEQLLNVFRNPSYNDIVSYGNDDMEDDDGGKISRMPNNFNILDNIVNTVQ